MIDHNCQGIFNVCFGTSIIYALLLRWQKHIDIIDYDGVLFLSKMSKRFHTMIRPMNTIISLTLLCIATILSILISMYTNPDIATEFIFVFIGTYHSYELLFDIMNKYIVSFRNIDPAHKKMYVIKNFVKATMLAGLCIVIVFNISDLLNGKMDINLIKRCAIYYVINDSIGLLLVDKLPSTTKIHHSITSICGLLVQFKTSNELDTLFLIITYAIFSSLAYCVNYYLGLRVFSGFENVKKIMSIMSFWVYLLSCFINWLIQLYLAVQLYKGCFYSIWDKIINIGVNKSNTPVIDFFMLLQFFLYVGFFTAVAKDDIVLMKWLFNDHRSMSVKNK